MTHCVIADCRFLSRFLLDVCTNVEPVSGGEWSIRQSTHILAIDQLKELNVRCGEDLSQDSDFLLVIDDVEQHYKSQRREMNENIILQLHVVYITL